MIETLENIIKKLKELFLNDVNSEKIQNKCFNKEKIKKLEESLKELKEELKNKKYECHDVKDTHFMVIKDATDTCVTRVGDLLKDLGIKKEKSKSNFNLKPCCTIYEELEKNLRYIKVNIMAIENKLKIDEDLNAEKFQLRFSFGQYKNLSLEMAKTKKNDASAITDQINNEINNGFKTFQNEQKEKEKKFEEEKKLIRERITELEDKIFGISKDANGNKLYHDLKLEVYNLTFDLLRAKIEHDKKSKTKKIIGGILIGIGALSLCVLAAPVAGAIAAFGTTVATATNLGLTVTALAAKTTVLSAGAISAIGGTRILVKDYLDNKKKQKQIEEYKDSTKEKFEPTKITKSNDINDEIINMKGLIIKFEEAHNKCIKNNVDLETNDINKGKEKLSKVLHLFEKECMSI